MELRPNHQFDPFGPEAPTYDSDDDHDFSNIDFNDPASFMRAIGGSGLPIPKLMSPTDVRREAMERSRNIFAHHDKLREILKRHEATIQKRWSKKTKKQRLKILLEAWPDMPRSHRPDFEAFRKESEQKRDEGTGYRNRFLWPYINQEDLTQSKMLLLLINSRGRHPPSDFAATDCGSMRFGMITKAVVPIFLNQYVMLLNSVTAANDYGKLLAWDDHPDAFDWMHTQKQFLPGEGLLVLEIQERLLTFLVECCQQLLHDLPANDLTSDAIDIQPEPQLKTGIESTGFGSLAVMAAEAPYKIPSQLDLTQIESLLAAKTSAAEDHLWSLREDPSYFFQEVMKVKEHRQEMVNGANGLPHPLAMSGNKGIFWTRIIGKVVLEAYFELEIFTELRRQAKELQSLKSLYDGIISPSKDLPEEYLKALLKFRHYLNQAAKGPLNQLKESVPASPPMRKFFVRDDSGDSGSTRIVIKTKPGLHFSDVEAQLTWLLRILWEDGKELFLAHLPLVVDELERLLQSEKQAHGLISDYISETIGNLSIICQCITQLELYQPWARSFENAFFNYEQEIQAQFSERSKPWGQIMAAIQDQSFATAATLGEPTGGRFAYPFDKRHTKENVDALRKAEENLDTFWAQVDRVIYAKAGRLDGTAVRQLLSQPRTLSRTQEWIEPTKTTTTEKTPSADIYLDSKPLSSFYFNLASQRDEVPLARSLPPKNKAKTRGRANPTLKSAADDNQLLQENPADPQPSFHVDARALKVFRALFFNPTMTTRPGEVPWSDFLHAMSSTGFVVQKLYGSVWQFRPTKLDVDRSIQFHEPHPHPKISFTSARRFGRRLNRAYGWFGGMFVLKEI
ncbi:hypothetical protein F5884DRAFT_796055 [Xylogone sp. PMI_703]|nr:hypothetical protein F5884DRAFT_796055 [Xylogone sp. PMI_703]